MSVYLASSASNPAQDLAVERVPWPIWVFLVLTVLVPVEFGFFIGPLFMTWSKAFLLLLCLCLLPLAPFRLDLGAADWFFFAHTLWTLLAYLIGFGISEGLQSGGTYVIEMMGAYVLMRYYLRTFEQIVAVIRLLFWLVLVSTALAIPEALIGVRYIHSIAKSITGIPYTFYNGDRFGLLRAAAAFEHPIHFGMFCSALLGPMWFTSRGTSRIVKTVVIAIGAFLSLSSAPLLVFLAQAGLIGLERVTRWLRHRVAVFASLFVGLVVFLQVASGRGAVGWLTVVMLNGDTAWYRKAQLDYSMDDIMRHPFFGLGTEDWTRPPWLSSSIDDHFLAIVLRSGLPALVFFVAAIYFIWRSLARIDADQQTELFWQLRTGWGMMLVALIFGAVTVTFFGRMQPLFAFYLGLGVSIAAAASAAPAVKPKKQPLPVGRPVRYRVNAPGDGG